LPKELTRWINEHEFPEIYFRIPGLLTLQYLTNRVLYHRTWLIRREIKRSFRAAGGVLNYLDAGCGAGDFLIPFVRQFRASQFTGLDCSGTNLKVIRNFVTCKRWSGVELIESDLTQFKSGNEFDLILLASVLHYLPDSRAAIRLLADQLTEEGTLIIYVPLNYRRIMPGYSWLRDRLLSGVDYENGKPRRVDLTVASIQADLAEAGLSADRMRYLYGPAGQVAYEITSLTILMIKRVPWILSVIATIVYFPVVQPVVSLLQLVDYLSAPRTGNGLILIARKDRFKK